MSAGRQNLSGPSESNLKEKQEDSVVLPLVEEELVVGKREVVTGRTRVSTVTETHEQLVQESLLQESIDVARVPIGTLVEKGAPLPKIRKEGSVTIYPVFEEVLITEKRIFLKEELHMTHVVTTETVEARVELRKQIPVIERLDQQGNLIIETQETSS